MNVVVSPIRLRWADYPDQYRYIFRFPRFRQDEKTALRIAECILNAVGLVHGPYIVGEEGKFAYQIPVEMIRDRDHITVDEFVRHEITSGRLAYSADLLGSVTFLPYSEVNTAWKLAPHIYHDVRFYHAIRFLIASQKDFYLLPVEITRVKNDPNRAAETGDEQSRLENALQNAFKAIEAILGDPPKDDQRFFAKITSIGLNPAANVGYTAKIPLYQMIRNMNTARDKKAAHGSTRNRTITIAELMEYQECARRIVWSALETKMEQKGQ